MRLTEKQKRYAATDAWICLQIFPLLQADNTVYPPLPDENGSAENNPKTETNNN
jgi:hypothetical protein